jgi:hypothetical protein
MVATGDLAKALDASLAKAFVLLGAPRMEAWGVVTAILWLLVPFVRKALIEGVYGFSVGDGPPREMIENVCGWGGEGETESGIVSTFPYARTVV